MKIVDLLLLQEFRDKDRCEWCRKYTRTGLDPHHVYCRGLGGAFRLDIRINMVSLCRQCHVSAHTSCEPCQADLLAVIAKRESMTVDAVEREIFRLKSLTKEGKHPNELRRRKP